MDSKKTFSEQHPSSNITFLLPSEELKLASTLGDLELVDLQALKCSVSLANLTNRAPEQCHQPAAHTSTLRKRIANYAKIVNNATGGNKPVPRITEDVKTVQRFVEKEQCPGNKSVPRTTEDVKTIQRFLEKEQCPGNKPVPRTTEDVKTVQRFVEKEQCPGNKSVPRTTEDVKTIQRFVEKEQCPGNKSVPRTTEDVKTVQRFVEKEQCVVSQSENEQIMVQAHTALKPIDSIALTNFCPSINQALEHLGIRKVYQMQGHAWRHIMRGNSVMCVNSAGTGKTLAYLPAVCSLIELNISENWVPSDYGPVGIIICPSSMEVQRISTLCRAMLNSEAEKRLSVVECYSLRLVVPVLKEMLAGCAILVTTAPAYRRLYEAMPQIFVSNRIQLVVIDNIVQMLLHFGPDLQLLCKSCDKPYRQMIVTANHWDPTLRSFQLRYNMITLIGAHLEAAVYGKVQWQLRLQRDGDSKQQELARYLLDHDYRSQRTIVFGSTFFELDLIQETLRHYLIEHLVCNEYRTELLSDSFRYWENASPGEMGVLICLDEFDDYLPITNAQHIVHYSLPDSWMRFTRRFATSFKYFKFDSGEQAKARPSTLVLLDEQNNQQLPKLIDFLELHHVECPAELCALAQKIRNADEYVRVTQGRAALELCPQLLALADCRNISSCVYRHALLACDLAIGDSLLSCGTVVRLNICHVFSPVHFSARLEASRGEAASSWAPLCNPEEFFQHDKRMQAHFANLELDHQYRKELMPNDLCALFHEQTYWRCRIVNFESEGDSTTVVEVQLKLIDTGRMVNTKSTNLLFLPGMFHTLPGQAIDVRIAGVVPLDYEDEWDQKSTKLVQRWIDDHVQQPSTVHHYVQGEVLLALRDTIWIDEMLLVEQLDSSKSAVISTKIKSSILSDQIGVYDGGSFERIQQMVQNCKAPPADTMIITSSSPPDCGQLESELTVKRSLVSAAFTNQPSLPASPGRQTPLEGEHSKGNYHSISSTNSFDGRYSLTWAKEKYRFEQLREGKSYLVRIGEYISPDLFYVYRIDSDTAIKKKITEFTTEKSNLKQLAHLQVGVYCLANYGNDYYRSQIVEHNDKETTVYMLDYGSQVKCHPTTLYEIPNYLLRDYPFAAIEAKLGLIEPLHDSTWTEEISEAIMETVLTKCEQTGLLAHVLKKLDPRHEAGAAGLSIVGCQRYELLLANPNSTDLNHIIRELGQRKLALAYVSSIPLL